MTAVDSDCFFFRNFLSVLSVFSALFPKPMAVVLALGLSSWMALCFLFFLFLDLDLDLSVLSRMIRLFSSLRLFCDFSFYLLTMCRLLMEGLLGFCDSFFLCSVLFSSIALPHELLYLRLSSASFNLVVSSMMIWCLLAFLLMELRLIRESRSYFLLVESILSLFLLGSG